MSAIHPPTPSDLAGRLRLPTGLLLGVLFTLWITSEIRAPDDQMQGVVQKILYLHAPSAFAAYLGFFLTAVGGALFLWRDDERWDRLARCAAEVGVLFCTLVIVTGPFWARGTWGRWWSWDLRLTLTLLLWFVYLAYLLLRGFTEGSHRAARFAGVYGLVAVLTIPLNYLAVDLAGGRTLHPENLERGSLGAGMGWPFALGVATAVAALLHLLVRRLEVEGLREQLARRRAAPAQGGSWAT